MYYSTVSQTISEATAKLLTLKSNDLVFNCPIGALTDAQRDCLSEYFHEMGLPKAEREVVAEHLYNNLTDNHIYILEECEGTNGDVFYFYEELIPTIELLQDQNGNLYYYEGLDEDTSYYKATIVEEHNGRYINTSIMVYMTDEELEQTTRIVVEGR